MGTIVSPKRILRTYAIGMSDDKPSDWGSKDACPEGRYVRLQSALHSHDGIIACLSTQGGRCERKRHTSIPESYLPLRMEDVRGQYMLHTA